MITPEKWVGYLEHRSSILLGVYTANVGKGGYTIFAEIVYERYGKRLQGVPWCATFVHAVFNRADLLGKPHAGTRVLQRRMKRKGLWRGKDYVPMYGDLVFCSNSGTNKVNHIGIVTSIDGDSITSVDGNTVDPSGTFTKEEGGAVAFRTRKLDSPIIVGYGAVGQYL